MEKSSMWHMVYISSSSQKLGTGSVSLYKTALFYAMPYEG